MSVITNNEVIDYGDVLFSLLAAVSGLVASLEG